MRMNGIGKRSQYKESEMVEMVDNVSAVIRAKEARATCNITIIVLFIVSMILVVVGISLIIVSSSKSNDCTQTRKGDAETAMFCGFSQEATRTGFKKFLKEMKSEFFRLHPHQSYHDPSMDFVDDMEVLRNVYKPFDPKPSNLKTITDASRALLERLNAMKLNANRLKPRERKALIQAKHYLKHIFGQTYDLNYYAGDWMMGPNHFCWQPICDIGKDIFYHLDYFKPTGLEGLEELRYGVAYRINNIVVILNKLSSPSFAPYPSLRILQ